MKRQLSIDELASMWSICLHEQHTKKGKLARKMANIELRLEREADAVAQLLIEGLWCEARQYATTFNNVEEVRENEREVYLAYRKRLEEADASNDEEIFWQELTRCIINDVDFIAGELPELLGEANCQLSTIIDDTVSIKDAEVLPNHFLAKLDDEDYKTGLVYQALLAMDKKPSGMALALKNVMDEKPV